jgi:hypothetical protein
VQSRIPRRYADPEAALQAGSCRGKTWARIRLRVFTGLALGSPLSITRGGPHERTEKDFGGIWGAVPDTFATSIPALALFQPVLDDPQGYIAGSGADSRITSGRCWN